MLKVIKFSAEWCSPCLVLKPIYASVKTATTDVEFVEVDIDEDPVMAAQFKVMAVPTLVFIKDGMEVDRLVGLVKAQTIQDKVAALK